MQAANAIEVQRKIVVRTKSGSFTNPTPRTLWIIAEQSAAAACIANTHGGALLSKFRAMGLGLPLNSVLESKLNHDLLQQSRSGDANGCLPDGVAGKTWDAGFGFRVLASAKSYSHSLNSFLFEKAELICDF